MYLLDTDICSYFLQKKFRLREKFREIGEDQLVLSRITLVELRTAAYKLSDPAITGDTVDELAQTLQFLDCHEMVWDAFSSLKARQRLRPDERRSRDFDLLQAAFAYVHGLVLVTNNSGDYNNLPIQIECWARQDPATPPSGV